MSQAGSSRASARAARPHVYRKTFVGDLPYKIQKAICEYVDADVDAWRELGELMKFEARFLDALKTRTAEGGISRTKALLEKWTQGNHTAEELFLLLKEVGETRAMRILLPFVKKDLHKYMESDDFTIVLKAKKPARSKPPAEGRSRDGEDDDSDGEIPSSAMYLRQPEAKAEEQKNMDKREGGHNNLNASGDRLIPEDKMGNDSRSPNIRNRAPDVRFTRTENSVAGAPSNAANLKTAIGKALEGVILVDFSEIQEATNFFSDSNIIGRGGFGTVFRGNWKHTSVAIKRIEPRHQTGDLLLGESVFKQSLVELKTSSQYKHPNILQLYAYAMDTALYLIFEFMPNGSLEDRLLCKRGTPPLDCRIRLSIAAGVAAGIQFLHTVIPTKPLIHGDIKSANILLDSAFQPKLGDFGLAREGPDMSTSDMTHVQVSRVRGTKPYLPDEYLKDKDLSPRVDTYSFGIVLLELSTGRRAWDDKRLLRDWVDERVAMVPLPPDLLDRRAGPEGRDKLLRLLKLGLHCAARKKEDRPVMVRVFEELRDFNALQEKRTRQISLPASLDLDRGQLTPYEQSLLMEQQRLISVSRSPLPSWAFQHGSLAGMQTPGLVPSAGSVSPHVLSTASIPSALASPYGVRQPLLSSAGRSSNDPRIMARPGYPMMAGAGLLRPVARHLAPNHVNHQVMGQFQHAPSTPSPQNWPPQATGSTSLSTQSNNAGPVFPPGALPEAMRPSPTPAATPAGPMIPTVIPASIPTVVPASVSNGLVPFSEAGAAKSPGVASSPSPVIPDFAALNIGGAFGASPNDQKTDGEQAVASAGMPGGFQQKTNYYRPMLTVLLSGDKSTETRTVAHPKDGSD